MTVIKQLPPAYFLSHDLDDESNSDPQHSVEQLRLSLNEHGQVNEKLLKEVKKLT